MTQLRLIRIVTGAALAALVLGIASPARAQGILGRARDRARQALAGNNQPSGPACSSSDQSRASAALSITGDFVTRYLRGMQARQTEIRRLAGENSQTGRYFAATLLRDSLARRHAMYRHHFGPDWDRYQQLMNRPPSTDAQVNMRNYTAAAQIERDLDESRAQVPDVPWDQMQAANNRLDEVARQAGGFSACDWGASLEVIPGVVQFIAQDRRENRPARVASDFPVVGRSSGLRESELTEIRAHASELALALGVDYPSDAELAAAQRETASRDSMTNAMNAWQACQQRFMGSGASPTMGVSQDSMRAWAAQAEDARKRGDQAAMMAIGTKMAMAMSPGMQQQAMGMAQARQQCGPMPGTPK